ncbi:MAG: hypothetical protein RRY12_01325 [Cloacibacillus sp.]
MADILLHCDSLEPVNGYPTAAEERVYPSRRRKLNHSQLPCLLVYTNSESCEIFNESPRSYKKTLSLVIGVVAEDNEALDDLLDKICSQVEQVFNEHIYLGASYDELVEECHLLKTELGFSVDCDVQTGGAAMTFEVIYYEDAVNSGQIKSNRLVPFKHIDLDTKPMGSLADTPTEKDHIDLAWEKIGGFI